MNGFWLAPANVDADKNCYFRAVRVLDTEKPTTVDIAAESYYIFYVNGKIVNRGPVRGTRRHNYFDTYEISDYLHPGENVIALLIYCMNIPTFMTAVSQPAFCVELNGQRQNPEDWRVSPAADWRKDTPLYTKQTGFAEWRDLRLEPEGWTLGKGVDNWETAFVISADREIYSKKLVPRDVPQLRESVLLPVDIPVKAAVPRVDELKSPDISRLLTNEKHLPLPQERLEGLDEWLIGDRAEVTLLPGADGEGIVIVFNFDAEIIGRLELEIDGVDGAVVDICYEEELQNDRLKADNPSHDTYNFADRYILRRGRQLIGNTINERGFRIVQVVFRNFKKALSIRSVRAVKAVYPYTNRGTFICDDFILNRIWDVCGETLSVCTTDVFIDCPWRERAFWVNDLIVENKTSLEFFGASAVHRRAFRMVFSDARNNGLIAGVCPCPDINDKLIFPATNLFMPLMLRDYLMYSGDTDLIKELLPGVFKIIDAFDEWMDEQGMITPPENLWNFFDWSFGTTGISLDGKNTSLLNYLYVMALNTAIELASFAETSVDVKKYRGLAAKTAESTNRFFFKPGESRLADWLEADGRPSKHSSQLAHAIALLSGKVPDIWRKDYELALDDDNILVPELYLSYLVFRAMRLCNMESAVLKRIKKYWRPIVESGSPTIWESMVHEKGKKAFGESGSLCHGFATAPVDFMQSVILGVEPLKPGFAEFRLAPALCGLRFAKGRIPTPSGNIYIHWKARGNGLLVILHVPLGTVAICDDGRSFKQGKHQFKLVNTRKDNNIDNMERKTKYSLDIIYVH